MRGSVQHIELQGIGAVSIGLVPCPGLVVVQLTIMGALRSARLTPAEARELGVAFLAAADRAQASEDSPLQQMLGARP